MPDYPPSDLLSRTPQRYASMECKEENYDTLRNYRGNGNWDTGITKSKIQKSTEAEYCTPYTVPRLLKTDTTLTECWQNSAANKMWANRTSEQQTEPSMVFSIQ